jgi:hypothetical protein
MLEDLIANPANDNNWHIDDDKTYEEDLTIWVNEVEAGGPRG